MVENTSKLEADRQALRDAQAKGGIAKLRVYTRLAGPGWLQSALTLGGGTMGSSLYLGILAGVSMLWLQPFAMLMGIVMMSAIAYVTMSTGERPLAAINRHVNPVLGWSWAAAAMAANIVWSPPQYSLSFAVVEQNLFPGVFTGDGPLADGDTGKWLVAIICLVIATAATWGYGSGGVGVKIYEWILKAVVGLIVVCFVGVVARMSLSGDGLDWGAIFAGFVPDINHLFEPAATFRPLLDAIGDQAARDYWSTLLISQQRDVMISAAAAAVGINMTFLLPYSMISRGWGKEFRGLAVFDLSTGMFIPFLLTTSCVIIASATQFHTQVPEGFVIAESQWTAPEKFQAPYSKLLEGRESSPDVTGPISAEEQKLAAVLVTRDTQDLASSLRTLFANRQGEGGKFFGDVVFGIGVVAMTLSSISLMMLISGFVVCEAFGIPAKGWVFRIGCMISGVSGVFWPLIWTGGSKAWLTVVAGVFGAMLLPIAYFTFFLLMNQRSLLGAEMPRGGRRVVWNVLMAVAAFSATVSGVYAIWKRSLGMFGTGWWGIGAIMVFLTIVLVAQFTRTPPESADAQREA